MFNGYHETPATSYNELELDRGKKVQNASKWHCGNGAGMQANHVLGQSHQADMWTSKAPLLGLPNAVANCSCPSCHQMTDTQSYQGDLTWHRSWLSRTFPVPLNASSSHDHVKLQANHHHHHHHQWENGAALPCQANSYGDRQYLPEGGEKPLLYKSYANPRHGDMYQSGVVPPAKSCKVSRKEDLPKASNEIPRFASAVPNPGYESFHGSIDRRRLEEGSGYYNQSEKFLNLESSCRQQSGESSYHLHGNVNRHSFLEPFYKGMSSNANESRVPSVGHRNVKDGAYLSCVEQNVADMGKVVPLPGNQSSFGEDAKLCRPSCQGDAVKDLDPMKQENVHGGIGNHFPATPVAYQTINFNRDLTNSFADKDFQKYLHGRNSQYFPVNNLAYVVKNGQNFVMDPRKDYGGGRRGVGNPAGGGGAPRTTPGEPTAKLADIAKSPSFGKYNSKDCVMSEKSSMSDLEFAMMSRSAKDLSEGFQKSEEMMRSESVNLAMLGHMGRSQMEGNEAYAPEKDYACLELQNNLTSYKGCRRSDYTYPRRGMQGPYEYPTNGTMNLSRGDVPAMVGHEGMVNFQHAELRNDLEGFPRLGSNFPYHNPHQQTDKIHSQLGVDSGKSQVESSPFFGAQSALGFPTEKPSDRISHLESIRNDDLCKNGTTKISPLRLLRKKKFVNQKKEVAAEAAKSDAAASSSKAATPPLDVRRFWATWAEEEEESSLPQTQMIVSECQNLDSEQGLLHLYYSEPVRAVDVEDPNTLSMKSSYSEKISLERGSADFDSGNLIERHRVSNAGENVDAKVSMNDGSKDCARRDNNGDGIALGLPQLMLQSTKDTEVKSDRSAMGDEAGRMVEQQAEAPLFTEKKARDSEVNQPTDPCDNGDIISVFSPFKRHHEECDDGGSVALAETVGDATTAKDTATSSDSSEESQTGDMPALSDLPTSEYRKNKFLDYTEGCFLGGGSGTLSRSAPPDSCQTFAGTIKEAAIPEGEDDDNSRLKEVILEVESDLAGSHRELSSTALDDAGDVVASNFEIDEILQKLSDINFQSPDVGDRLKSAEAVAVARDAALVTKHKTEREERKFSEYNKRERRSKKVSHRDKSSRSDQLTLQNISLTKPTIKFSIQKSHDLKISFKVLNNAKKREKSVSEGEDNRDEDRDDGVDADSKDLSDEWDSIEGADDAESPEGSPRNGRRLITLKLKGVTEEEEEEEGSDDGKVREGDESARRNKRKALKKKRYRGERSPTSMKTPVLRIKKSRYMLTDDSKNEEEEEEEGEGEEEENGSSEKGDEKRDSNPLDDFQVHETVDSANIKLTFKRNKNTTETSKNQYYSEDDAEFRSEDSGSSCLLKGIAEVGVDSEGRDEDEAEADSTVKDEADDGRSRSPEVESESTMKGEETAAGLPCEKSPAAAVIEPESTSEAVPTESENAVAEPTINDDEKMEDVTNDSVEKPSEDQGDDLGKENAELPKKEEPLEVVEAEAEDDKQGEASAAEMDSSSDLEMEDGTSLPVKDEVLDEKSADSGTPAAEEPEPEPEPNLTPKVEIHDEEPDKLDENNDQDKMEDDICHEEVKEEPKDTDTCDEGKPEAQEEGIAEGGTSVPELNETKIFDVEETCPKEEESPLEEGEIVEEEERLMQVEEGEIVEEEGESSMQVEEGEIVEDVPLTEETTGNDAETVEDPCDAVEEPKDTSESEKPEMNAKDVIENVPQILSEGAGATLPEAEGRSPETWQKKIELARLKLSEGASADGAKGSRRHSWEGGTRIEPEVGPSVRKRSESLNVKIPCEIPEVVEEVTGKGCESQEVPQLDISVWDIPLPPGDPPAENCLNLEEYIRKKLARKAEEEREPEVAAVNEPEHGSSDAANPQNSDKQDDPTSCSELVENPIEPSSAEPEVAPPQEVMETPVTAEETTDEPPQELPTAEESVPKSTELVSGEMEVVSGLDEDTTTVVDKPEELPVVKDDAKDEGLEGVDGKEEKSSLELDPVEQKIDDICDEYTDIVDQLVDMKEAVIGTEQGPEYKTDELFECEEGHIFDESFAIIDGMEEEKVSDDDKFRNMMQNCLENAKKFLNFGNLKLFSCSVDDLLEIDCRITDTSCMVDGDGSKEEGDNHISKDVLLTSCEESGSEELVLVENEQPLEISVDFVPSFCSDEGSNLCSEIVPVENWPYLEEEVPSSPTKAKPEEDDLLSTYLEKSSEVDEAPVESRSVRSKKKQVDEAANAGGKRSSRDKDRRRRVSVSVTDRSSIFGQKRPIAKGEQDSGERSEYVRRRRNTVEGVRWRQTEEENAGSEKEGQSDSSQKSRVQKKGCLDEEGQKRNEGEAGRKGKNGGEYKSPPVLQPQVVLFRISKSVMKDLSMRSPATKTNAEEVTDVNCNSIQKPEPCSVGGETEEVRRHSDASKSNPEGSGTGSEAPPRKRKKRFRNLHTKKKIRTVPDDVNLTKEKETPGHKGGNRCKNLVDSESDSDETATESCDIPKAVTCSQSKSTKAPEGATRRVDSDGAPKSLHGGCEQESRTARPSVKKEPSRREREERGERRNDEARKDHKRKRDSQDEESRKESDKLHKRQHHSRESEEGRRKTTGETRSGHVNRGSGERDRTSKTRHESDRHRCWVCEVCGFSKSSERAVHIQSHPFHCQSCHLAFKTETNFVEHLTRKHKDIRNQHHCLLCELSFDSEKDYHRHLETREHKHLESVEKNTINTLFTLLTGQPCPALGPFESRPEWLPTQAGTVHFYHQATPLSLALQYLKLQGKTTYSTATLSPQSE